jgi:putative transposase
MMQGVTLCYTQHINRKYQRTGRLWASRYCSCIVEEDAYLWAAARYVEMNPVRASMVERPEDYVFSSARGHMGLVRDAVVGDGIFPDDRRKDYIAFLGAAVTESELKDIRRSSGTGRPLGTESFISRMEDALGRRLAALPIGRPRSGGGRQE